MGCWFLVLYSFERMDGALSAHIIQHASAVDDGDTGTQPHDTQGDEKQDDGETGIHGVLCCFCFPSGAIGDCTRRELKRERKNVAWRQNRACRGAM